MVGFFLFSIVEAKKKQTNGKKTQPRPRPPLYSTALPHLPGLNVALLSRTESKLTAAASEIEAKYKVDTKVVAVDFGAATAADYGRIAGVVGDLDVAVLVNNVGLSYDDAIDDKLIDDLIAINIQATNKASRCFLLLLLGFLLFCFLFSLPLLTSSTNLFSFLLLPPPPFFYR